jgi:hypothetical protein
MRLRSYIWNVFRCGEYLMKNKGKQSLDHNGEMSFASLAPVYLQ